MIRIGTAGWEYPDWYGVVYPKKRSARFDPLAAMSEIFDTIEINSTFYRTPSPRAAESWARRIAANPAFLFTLKLPRTFTHARVVRPESGDFDPDAEERRFRAAIAPLREAGRLGAVSSSPSRSIPSRKSSRSGGDP
jgi:uncharacterized protein YecE (DUF72 family)